MLLFFLFWNVWAWQWIPLYEWHLEYMYIHIHHVHMWLQSAILTIVKSVLPKSITAGIGILPVNWPRPILPKLKQRILQQMFLDSGYITREILQSLYQIVPNFWLNIFVRREMTTSDYNYPSGPSWCHMIQMGHVIIKANSCNLSSWTWRESTEKCGQSDLKHFSLIWTWLHVYRVTD